MTSYMQSQRQRVTSLSPLTQKQADYLYSSGYDMAGKVYRNNHTWWTRYFGVAETEINNPYFDTSSADAFVVFRDELARDLNEAKTNREHWRQMAQAGRFPPDLLKLHPYVLPPYFGWWQAENAFRRGFKAAWDAQLREQLHEAFGEVARRGGGMLSDEDARSLGDSGGKVVARFFEELGDAIAAAVESGGARPFGGSRKNILDALQRVLDASAPQFSPFYYPIRSVGGGGFTGVGFYGDE